VRKHTILDIQGRLDGLPRVELIHRPTPFRRLENLSSALGGPSLSIKRDDLTGFAFGGNKSRKLEFIIRDALDKRADAIITWGGLQSNWCMQTAAAARRFGIRPILVLFKTPGAELLRDGNLFLDDIIEAEIHVREAEKGKVVKAARAMKALEEIADQTRARGLKPYLAPIGGSFPMGDMSRPLGAASYVGAFAEMLSQAEAEGVRVDAVVHATGSGGTQAGLVVGAAALGACRVIGISVSDPKGPFSEDVLEIARATNEMLGLGLGLGPEDVTVFDDYIREGYGVVDADVAAVIRLVFEREGIVLDPVYTAKAMAGLIDLVRRGYFKKGENVVFFHTGGTPALFPHRESILSLLPKA
jgi:L-cysteate sulfo-lyase